MSEAFDIVGKRPVTDRPIIFSSPMVQALLAGTKTQTRRLATSPLRRCEVGDRLYVREAWRVGRKYDGVKPRDLAPRAMTVLFEAGGSIANQGAVLKWAPDEWPPVGALPGFAGTLRPSIHMLRWASRLTLTVEAVRVQRLQAISTDDACAEGVHETEFYEIAERKVSAGAPFSPERLAYAYLWNALHGAEGKTWEANPEVVALTFRVERGNIDRSAG